MLNGTCQLCGAATLMAINETRGLQSVLTKRALWRSGDTSGMAHVSRRRNSLTPWYVGIVIILACVLFVGYRMWAGSCPAPTIIELGVLIVIPTVYLALMYLTFRSLD
jgi:hypothetical protein